MRRTVRLVRAAPGEAAHIMVTDGPDAGPAAFGMRHILAGDVRLHEAGPWSTPPPAPPSSSAGTPRG
ncbi:hypothetical protein ACIOEX_22650 [Streptomyces sp. NPDC087850]|uniref:hypothetical protein n=1 Tax=unclassified Streptomyces TaxID=2593676 RepID=UPI0038199A38